MGLGRGPVQRLRKTATRYAESGYHFTQMQVKSFSLSQNSSMLLDHGVWYKGRCERIADGVCKLLVHKAAKTVLLA